MGFLSNFVDETATAKLKVRSSKDVFNDMLKTMSGSSLSYQHGFNILYQINAFHGVVDGIGTSTLVANTALALASLGENVLVIDTSILAPTQDTLLKTKINEENPVDWFDLPYTKFSVLHPSSYNNKISVLSFKGKKHGVVDAIGVKDNKSLVEMALTELHNKFDVILIDCCQELTAVNTTCLQMANKVYQVWNDSPAVLENVDAYIDNCVTLSCSLDKMRKVIYSRITNQVMGNMDALLSEYRCKKLCELYNSEEIYNIICQDKPLFQIASNDVLVEAYTAGIIAIACDILGIDLEKELKKAEEAENKGKKKKKEA